MRQVISILVEDRFGALARIVELFSSRGYNLDSICSGEAEMENAHRITIVTEGDDQKIEHIIKLLGNIVYVFDVKLLNPSATISRELALIKVKINSKNRNKLLQLIEAYDASIIEMNGQSVSFQVYGSASKLDGLTEVFREFSIIQLSRTGEAAIHK